MKFPNPFKRRHQSKDIHDLIGIPEEPGLPPEKKFSGPLKGMRQRRADVAALAKAFDAIEQIPDPGARLLQYKDLKEACDGMAVKMMGVPGTGVKVGGVAMTFAAVLTLNPLLLIGGILTTRAGSRMRLNGEKYKKWTVSPALSRDYKTLVGLAAKVDNAAKSIIAREPLLNIAQSPHCEEATAAFPALKDRFLAAVARDRLIQDHKPNKPDGNDGKGFNP